MGPVGSFLRYFAGALCPIGSFTDLLRALFFFPGYNLAETFSDAEIISKKKKVSVFFMFFFSKLFNKLLHQFMPCDVFFQFFCRRSPPGRAFADDEGLEESLWSTKETRRLQVLKDSIKKHSPKKIFEHFKNLNFKDFRFTIFWNCRFTNIHNIHSLVHRWFLLNCSSHAFCAEVRM